MDSDWARQQLESFLVLWEPVPAQSTSQVISRPGSMTTRGTEGDILAAVQVVEQILDRVIPEWRQSRVLSTRDRWLGHREMAQRALAQLNHEDELREHLGENAPQLDASRLHPWVWEGARSLWQSRHYAEAVQAAARKVNAETQNKIGDRRLSETALFQQAFTPDSPKPGSPRLRLGPDDGGKTFQSVHRGVMALAEGCYAALRNPGSHDPQDEVPEHEALEQLATFSVLARWVDRAEIDRAD